MSDRNDVVTKYQYDANNNLKQITYANNATTKFEYDNMNNQTKVVNGNNKATSYQYDLKGNLVSEKKPDGLTITYKYDALNNQTEKVMDSNTFAYSYNKDNQVTNITKNGNLDTIITLPIAALLVPSVGEMIEFYCTNLEYKESYFSKFIMMITTKKMENKIWNKYCLICVSLGYMLANVGIIIYVIFTLNEVNFWITQLLAVLSGVFGAALMVEVRNYLYSHQTKRVRILDVVFLNKFILRSNIENK